MSKLQLFRNIVAISVITTIAAAPASAQNITVQGKVADGAGIPLSGARTFFRVQIVSPDSNHCVLFDETRELDLSRSYGLFSLNIASAGGTRNGTSPYSLENVLSNRGYFDINGAECLPAQPGVTVRYTPTVTHNRKMIISFKDDSMPAWETMDEMDMNPVPFSIDSRNVGGFPVASLVRVSGGAAPAQPPNSPLPT